MFLFFTKWNFGGSKYNFVPTIVACDCNLFLLIRITFDLHYILCNLFFLIIKQLHLKAFLFFQILLINNLSKFRGMRPRSLLQKRFGLQKKQASMIHVPN